MISVLLSDVVQGENLALRSNATLRDAIELMNLNQKGVVAILEGKKPVGIVTERDIVKVLYEGGSFDEVIGRYAKKDLIVTTGSRSLGHALNLSIENSVRRIVVTDDSGDFSGIVTQQDLLGHLEEDVYRSTIKIKHIIEKRGFIIGVSPDDALRDVLKKMIDNNISALAVLEGQEAVGIITEKDILKLAGQRISLKAPVSRYMSSPVVTSNLDTSLIDVVATMNDRNIRRVVVINDKGQTVNMITIRDVLRNLEGDYNKFLERKLKSAKDILNLLPEMLIEVTDTGEEQVIIWANEKVLSKFGWDILDKPVTNFIPPENWKQIYTTIHTFHKIENIMFKKENDIFELSGFFVVTDGAVERGRFQLIMRDITEDVHLSTTDPLTMIYNRRFINEFLIKEIERCKRSGKEFSVVICDLDDFKMINDTYGHMAGDSVLKAFSRAVTESLRKLDVVGRYGGDEFVIILPEASTVTACMIINRLKDKIAELDITISLGVTVKLTASLGIATYPDDGTSSDDLLVKTDERLYQAKKKGKNQVVCIS